MTVCFISPVGKWMYGDAASGCEQTDYFYVSRLHELSQIVQYDVYAIFMEISMIAETEQIQLKALALYH